LDLPALLPELNASLPRALRVLRWVPASESFHARSSVQFREYRYRISLLPTTRQRLVGWTIPDPRSLTRSEIDLAAMSRFLADQLGSQDRRRFTTRPAPARNLTTTLFEASLRERSGAALEVRFVGNRFTRHLVRNWVGAALTVGTGNRVPFSVDGWHGIRAPGWGLILWDVGLQPDPFRTATDLPPGNRSW
jgi:tRNA pseudouridine38-40 synthase